MEMQHIKSSELLLKNSICSYNDSMIHYILKALRFIIILNIILVPFAFAKKKKPNYMKMSSLQGCFEYTFNYELEALCIRLKVSSKRAYVCGKYTYDISLERECLENSVSLSIIRTCFLNSKTKELERFCVENELSPNLVVECHNYTSSPDTELQCFGEHLI